RHGNGQRGRLGVGGGQRRVPHDGARLLDGDEHVGALVLDGLELADGSTELLAYEGIRRGGVEAPAGQADRLGSEEDSGELVPALGRAERPPLEASETAGRIEAGRGDEVDVLEDLDDVALLRGLHEDARHTAAEGEVAR